MIDRLELLTNGRETEACLYQNKIYFTNGLEVFFFDLKNPDQPKMAGKVDFNGFLPGCHNPDSRSFHQNGFSLSLPTLPGLKESERLEVAVKMMKSSDCFNFFDFDNNHIAKLDLTNNVLTIFQPRRSVEEVAFTPEGIRAPTPLEDLIRWSGQGSGNDIFSTFLRFKDHRVYALDNSGLTVYDFHNPKVPYRTGHFAAGQSHQFTTVAPLSDGRIILVGKSKLYILAPPQ